MGLTRCYKTTVFYIYSPIWSVPDQLHSCAVVDATLQPIDTAQLSPSQLASGAYTWVGAMPSADVGVDVDYLSSRLCT